MHTQHSETRTDQPEQAGQTKKAANDEFAYIIIFDIIAIRISTSFIAIFEKSRRMATVLAARQIHVDFR